MKKLTIITINYNNCDGLKKTVQSVVPQLNQEIEFIIIDGGSIDGSVDLIKANEKYIDVWVSEKDNGIYDAQNKGIAKARGAYCLFLNSGDYLYQMNTVKKVMPFLSNFDIIYGNMKIDNGQQFLDGYMPKVLSFEHMMNDTLWHPVSFIRRQLFSEYGFYDTNYKVCADYDFFFKMITVKKVSCFYIDEFISVFDLKGISSDEKNKQIIAAERKIIQFSYLSEKQINKFHKQIVLKNRLQRIKKWFQ